MQSYEGNGSIPSDLIEIELTRNLLKMDVSYSKPHKEALMWFLFENANNSSIFHQLKASFSIRHSIESVISGHIRL